jgi:hypothetical protein
MGADVEMKDGADKDEKKTVKEETPVAPQDVLDVVRASRVPGCRERAQPVRGSRIGLRANGPSPLPRRGRWTLTFLR